MKQLQKKNIGIKITESILVIGYIVFEEFVWNIFAKPVLHFFKSLRLFDALEKTVLGLNRYALLVVFLLILVVAEIMGFVSGILIFRGSLVFGLIIYTIKIPIAAFTFWLFKLTKETLMTFSWLKKSFDYIMEVVNKLLNSALHLYLRTRVVSVKTYIDQLVQQYFQGEGFVSRLKSHYYHYKIIFKAQLSKVLTNS